MVVINDSERGFLFKNGRFERMLNPGRYFVPAFLGSSVKVEPVGDEAIADVITLATYGKDKNFLDSIARADVADGQVALHCVDGRFRDILKRGSYAFWNIFTKHTFHMIDLAGEKPIEDIPAPLLTAIPEPSCKLLVINENERGFLFKSGHFIKMLLPGVHPIPAFLGYSADVDDVESRYTDKRIIDTYGRDKDFLESVVRVNVMDGQVALHYVDGLYSEVLEKGVYVFWDVFKKHTFKIIDISDDASLTEIPSHILEALPSRICKKVTAEDQEAVLLYIDGTFVSRLNSGVHYFWQSGRSVSCVAYDMRTTQVTISGQEILTSDKVELRVNLICSYRIVDPVQMNSKLKDYASQIYAAAQLALREFLGNMRFDEVLENKNSIAGEVLKLLKLKEGELFVEFLSAGMKDIILPGEVRDIMNTVLVAEKRAQANVITRREEVASTRSLLNTARLMDENTTLYKLKELEYLEKICENVSNISVNNASGLLEQLGSIMKV
jgi:regulator of protease activity HflC (stomatin/prohibitin superfamily)